MKDLTVGYQLIYCKFTVHCISPDYTRVTNNRLNVVV